MSERQAPAGAAATPHLLPDTPARPVVQTTLGQLVAELGGELIGDASQRITDLAPLDSAGPEAITFLASPKFVNQVAATQAACVIVSPKLQEAAQARGAVIVTPDPYLYFAHLTQWWARRVRPAAPARIHPSAVVDPTAQIAEGVTIAALAVIEAGAVLEAGVVVGSHTVVGERARIGAGTRLAPNVSVGFDCVIGERCILHSGAVIGADGFGFAPHQGTYVKIEQLGAVRIGDDVEIGANTCIDRGALGDTVIGRGVKLDNLIQIGHNTQIGDHTAMAGCVGVAGSAKIGAHCTVGGAGMILGHLTIVDNVHISSGTLISRSIHQPGHYSGAFPFDDNASWEKNAATLRQLHALRDRLRALEKQVKS